MEFVEGRNCIIGKHLQGSWRAGVSFLGMAAAFHASAASIMLRSAERTHSESAGMQKASDASAESSRNDSDESNRKGERLWHTNCPLFPTTTRHLNLTST